MTHVPRTLLEIDRTELLPHVGIYIVSQSSPEDTKRLLTQRQ